MSDLDKVALSFACLLIVGIVGHCYVLRSIFKVEQRQVEREEKFQQWLFDALYSINNKVVLPDSHEIEEEGDLKASVYSPEEDLMTEFSGGKDDWHGKKDA